MTAEQLQDILHATIRVAAAPPLKKGSYVFNAGVPWSRIEELRMLLDAAGIDWKAAR